MIEISHKQAEHLIREGVDGRLPDEQWAALQVHLEQCPQCRAFRERYGGSEKYLRRTLRDRWSKARFIGQNVRERIHERRVRREQARKFFTRNWWVFAGAVILAGYIGYRALLAPPPVPPLPTPTAALQNTPTAAPKISFRGLVAYEARRDGLPGGDKEIYLLNSTGGKPDVSDLTADPANDISPSWSPDGEWMAFLSDRTGKEEVYVITIAGSRLTQLTSSSTITWQGPLEWSNDSKWIALSGLRGGERYLYLVPLDGSAPRSIGLTRGAQPWARFSSTLPVLAFSAPHSPNSLTAVHVETGWTVYPTWEDSHVFQFHAGQDGAFDWSLGGRSLVFVANGPYNSTGAATPGAAAPRAAVSGPVTAGGTGTTGGAVNTDEAGSLLRLSAEFDAVSTTDIYQGGADTIDRLPDAGAFRAVSWQPNSLMVASLRRSSVDASCWILRLVHAYNHQVPPVEIPELCVEGSLERQNWTSDGNWLVLVARLPQEKTPAIYALRLPGETGSDRGASNAGARIERLGDLVMSPTPVEGQPEWPALRVRPIGRSLGLSPRSPPAASLPAEQTPAFPPLSGPGARKWLVYDTAAGQNPQAFRSRPDGSEQVALGAEKSSSICPRLSADGRVAFLLNKAGAGRYEVFVTSADRSLTTQLTHDDFSTSPDPLLSAVTIQYGCPVWSLDGQRIAVVAGVAGETYLAILPADGSAPAKYLLVEPVSSLSEPVWLPRDARGVEHILLVYPQGRGQARIVSVDVDSSQDRQPAEWNMTVRLVGWMNAWDLKLSPDGKRLGTILVNSPATSQTEVMVGQLRVYDAQSLDLIYAAALQNIDTAMVGMGGIGFLQDGRFVVARSVAMVGSQKSVIEVFDPRVGQSQATPFEDLIFRAAWDPAGWGMLTAESGVWAVNIPAAGSGQVTFSQVNREEPLNVDWK